LDSVDCLMWCATGFSQKPNASPLEKAKGFLDLALKRTIDVIALPFMPGAADIPIVRLNPFGALDIKADSEEKLRQTGTCIWSGAASGDFLLFFVIG
jgi:hypothetical protein